MVSVTYSSLTGLLNLDVPGDLSAAQAEDILDMAINQINLFANVSVSNMSGTAGSKTVTLTRSQWAAVYLVARVLYESGFKGVDGASTGGVTDSPSDPMSNRAVMDMVQQACSMLRSAYVKRT